ncbi:eukaryotic rRNA processing protein EBP2-domain-containing protein [Aspergillus taichungensis]|uniref:Eukaryotic rRNA processing protein EBP2-domain-containing protein n=1 Tax=Aspergillus taichungensis TaxID=482145 RepID=A0A2J5HFR9_9EURO|nr:eukaryotic rRNA processing protein EBP2-domain-containing protein [Aspergillus taichungensis]
MPKRSKLLQALDDHKGRDYAAEKQKKLVKAAEKRKAAKKAAAQDNDEEAEAKENVEDAKVNKEGAASDDEDDEEDEDFVAEENEDDEEEEEEEEEEDEEDEDEDIPLSDLSDAEAEDVVPHQRLTINNSAAINASLKRISFISHLTPFSEHNSLVSTEPINVEDPNDDLTRELAFYKVCQSAATTARGLLKKEGVPFTRPGDYFAEMVKTDEHMGRIKKKLYDEAAAKKASAEARKQRDLKKFGKQVQVAKLQQRQKEKRETLEKINDLKKKRKADSSGPTDDSKDLFDVAIEDAAAQPARKRARDGDSAVNHKRQKKNEKFGFGGRKRHAKSGDALSSGDLRNFSAKKMKGGAKRPGKSKRAAAKRG